MKNFKVIFKEEENRGTLICPFFYDSYGKQKFIEVNFSPLLYSKGVFSFAQYGILQFTIKSDNIKDAIKMAKERIKIICKNGLPKQNDIVIVNDFRLLDDNTKKPYILSFMENTHHQNQFTPNSYITKKGDLLMYDRDGDGWGFWYAIDENKNRISGRLKGGTFFGYVSDGVVTKFK